MAVTLTTADETLRRQLTAYLADVDGVDGGGGVLVQGHAALGHAVSFLMVNRAPHQACTLRLGADTGAHSAAAQPVVFQASAPAPAPTSGATGATGGSTRGSSVNGGGSAVPSACVDVFHLHCHFNGTDGSEAAARELLASTEAASNDSY